MALLKQIVASLIVAGAAENALRGTERTYGECVPEFKACNPVGNECCQGPRLMTCRMRANDADSDSGSNGMSYQCGAEFPNAIMKNPTCILQGQQCDPKGDSCCNPDVSRSMTCQLHRAKASEKEEMHICKPSVDDLAVDSGSCKLEGESCNPVSNKCCQDSSLGEKGLRTCQMKFATSIGVHGMAYVCASEFP
eukprot:TRINITY_DN8353_c0_g1_i5.p1 TRINITY_DN8353_c0_g1~~TRINITY_DN8353_c0_g1_i5.p1  ORF type:complete len:194 (+),score=33.72 TRINITY_DN8353_c0_g1_i5:91-672(+)